MKKQTIQLLGEGRTPSKKTLRQEREKQGMLGQQQEKYIIISDTRAINDYRVLCVRHSPKYYSKHFFFTAE